MNWKFLLLLFSSVAASLNYNEYVKQQHQEILEKQGLTQINNRQINDKPVKDNTLLYQMNNGSIIVTVQSESEFFLTYGDSDVNIQPTRSQNKVQTTQVPPHRNNQNNFDSNPPTISRTPSISGSSSTNNSFEKFNTNLFQKIAPDNIRKNVVYSPISLHTLMALVSLGAKGQTANELYQGLQLPKNRSETAHLFQNLLKADQLTRGSNLIMANKIYYSDKVNLKRKYENIAKNAFDSEFEEVDFRDIVSASSRMNAWVDRKTNGYIEKIVSPQALDAQTQMVLINAMYFKAVWAKEFSVADTFDDDFFITPDEKLRVKMMYADDKFRYGHFTDLKASVLEMPYKDSDLSMMIILPDEQDGLERLERTLNKTDLSTLSASLFTTQVVLRLPRFRIQFEIDMVEPLKNLNMRTIFSSNSDLSDMFHNLNQPMGISKIQHKAYIDVNEAGSEAAAASFGNIMPLSLSKSATMNVNHPFIFAIRSSKVVYFTGHVVNPSKF